MTVARAEEQGVAWADECFRLRSTPEFETLVKMALHTPDALEKIAHDRLITIGLEGTKDELHAFERAAFEKLQGSLIEQLKTYFPQTESIA